MSTSSNPPSLLRLPPSSPSSPHAARASLPKTPYPDPVPSESTPLLRGRDTARQSYFGSSAIGRALSRAGGRPRIPFARRDTGDYDELYEDEMIESGKGVRVWYDSFTSIDWVHDRVKETVRLRRLRHLRGVRGFLLNSWDRLQGWLVVTLIALTTALFAFAIVRTESLLFDLKSGYCARDWTLSQRFCCAPPPASHTPQPALLRAYNAVGLKGEEGEGEGCEGWRTWTEVVGAGSWAVEFVFYVIIALALASIASSMTVYLSASNAPWVNSHKDSHLDAYHHAAAGRRDSSNSSAEGAEEGAAKEAEQQEQRAKRKVMYFAAGSGIPEIKVILAGFVIRGYLGVWTLICKSVGLALAVASGLSLGKEGPMVQIAACVGNIVARFFRKFEANEGKRREVLSAACAAGVAVAFGAPIGGVLFSLEEVSTYFPPKVMWRSFFCATVAAAFLKFLDPFGTGKTVLFEVTYTQDWQFFELPFFLLIAVVGGVYGAYFSKLNIWWGKNVRMGTRMKEHPVVEVLLVTFLTVTLSFLNPFARMGGTEMVSTLLTQCNGTDSLEGLCVPRGHDPWPVIRMVAWAMLIKGALTIITFGIKLPAGIFVPTLGVGACFGRIVGMMVEHWSRQNPDHFLFASCRGKGDGCMLPAIYAMVGAASTLSGVTRMTVSLAVIVSELTGTLGYVVPTMLSILVAKTVADALEHKSIYDLVIEMNQLPFLDAKHDFKFGSACVLDVANSKISVIRVDKEHTVDSLLTKLDALVRMGAADGGFPLITKEDGTPRLIGYIAANEIEHALHAVAHNSSANVRFRPTAGQSTRASLYTPSGSRPPSVHTPHHAEAAPAPADPYDFTPYVDQAPLIVQPASPLELVQDTFVKLGARQVFVVDQVGSFHGVIYRKRWIEFLGELEKAEGH